MTFQVIPAIDVVGGRLARLSPDGPVAIEAHDGDPIAAARACLAAGAAFCTWSTWTSRSRARHATPASFGRSSALGARVQAAGAIVEDREIAAVLEAGSERVVLGSAALIDLDEARTSDRALR